MASELIFDVFWVLAWLCIQQLVLQWFVLLL